MPRTTDHALPPPILNEALVRFDPRPIESVERPRSDIEIELRPIGSKSFPESVEHFDRKATSPQHYDLSGYLGRLPINPLISAAADRSRVTSNLPLTDIHKRTVA